MMIVPSEYTFLVGPITFSGPYCQPNIVFQVRTVLSEYRKLGEKILRTLLVILQLDGTIIAPTDSKSWGKGLMWWIDFTKLKGIKVQGKGVIDGRGSCWWQQDYPFIDGETKLILPLNNSVQEPPPLMPVKLTIFSFFVIHSLTGTIFI